MATTQVCVGESWVVASHVFQSLISNLLSSCCLFVLF